jgi:hypothetical protein
MNPKRVPDLDWPTDLFRRSATEHLYYQDRLHEDRANPFDEPTDFAPARLAASAAHRALEMAT